MKVAFSQVYIEPGANFPFSVQFQRRLTSEVTSFVKPSSLFISTYGEDFKLVFNISAKKMLKKVEVKGPTVFKRLNVVDFTVFLPFEYIIQQEDPPKAALQLLLSGVIDVLDRLKIDKIELAARQDSLIEEICSDLTMLEGASWDDARNKSLVRTLFTASFQSRQKP